MRTSKRDIAANRIEGARDLRQRMTNAETALWNQLRHRGLDNLKFRRQHVFGPFVLDFCCPDARLVIELDGAVHDDVERQRDDNERTDYLTDNGYRVIRFRNEDVLTDLPNVLQRIQGAAMSPTVEPTA